MLFINRHLWLLISAVICLTSCCCLVPFVRAAPDKESSSVIASREEVKNFVGSDQQQEQRFIRNKRQLSQNQLQSAEEEQQQSIPAASPNFEAAFQGDCGGGGQIEDNNQSGTFAASNSSSASSSNRNPCEHICSDLHDGTYECSCFYGFALAVDGYSCTRLAAELNGVASTGGHDDNEEPPRAGESSRRNSNQEKRRPRKTTSRKNYNFPSTTKEAPSSSNLPGANSGESDEKLVGVLVSPFDGGGENSNSNSNSNNNIGKQQTNSSSSPSSQLNGKKNNAVVVVSTTTTKVNNWPTGRDDNNRNRTTTTAATTAADWQDKDKTGDGGGGVEQQNEQANGMQVVVERKLAKSTEGENNLALGGNEEDEQDEQEEEEEEEQDDDDDDIKVRANEISERSKEFSGEFSYGDNEEKNGAAKLQHQSEKTRTRRTNSSRSSADGRERHSRPVWSNLKQAGAKHRPAEEAKEVASSEQAESRANELSLDKQMDDSEDGDDESAPSRRESPARPGGRPVFLGETLESKAGRNKGGHRDEEPVGQQKVAKTVMREKTAADDRRTKLVKSVEYRLDRTGERESNFSPRWRLGSVHGKKNATASDQDDTFAYHSTATTDSDSANVVVLEGAEQEGDEEEDPLRSEQQQESRVDSNIKSIMLANDKLLGQFEIELSDQKGMGASTLAADDEQDDDQDEKEEKELSALGSFSSLAHKQQQKQRREDRADSEFGLSAKLLNGGGGKSKRSSEEAEERINNKRGKVHDQEEEEEEEEGQDEDERRSSRLPHHQHHHSLRNQFLDYDLNLLGDLVDETILDYHNQRSAAAAGESFASNEVSGAENVDAKVDEDDQEADAQDNEEDKYEPNGASLSNDSGREKVTTDNVIVAAVAEQQADSASEIALNDDDDRHLESPVGQDSDEQDDGADRTDEQDGDRDGEDKTMVVRTNNEIFQWRRPSRGDEHDADDSMGRQTNSVDEQQEEDEEENELVISYEMMPDCESAGGQCVVEASKAAGSRQRTRCRCPLGRGGYLCQKSVRRSVPRFSSQSYVRLPLTSAVGGGCTLKSLRILFKPEQQQSLASNNHIQSSSLLLYTNSFAILLDSMNRIEFRYLRQPKQQIDSNQSSAGGELMMVIDDDQDQDDDSESMSDSDEEMTERYFVPNQSGDDDEMISNDLLAAGGGRVTRVIGSRDVQMNKWNELVVTDASNDDYFNKRKQKRQQKLSSSGGIDRQQAVNRIVIVTPDKIDSMSGDYARRVMRRRSGRINVGGEDLSQPRQPLLFVGGLPDLSSSNNRSGNNDHEYASKVGTLRQHLKDVSNFVGCVRELTLNDKSYDFKSVPDGGDALDGFDIDECQTVID